MVHYGTIPIVDEADIMVHNGTTWVGYLDSTSPYYAAGAGDQTDPNGPIVSATEPWLQTACQTKLHLRMVTFGLTQLT